MNKKGFTLVEMLVVVLIIGILASIAVPQYQKAVAKAKFTQLKLAAHAIANAEEAYFLSHGDYASNLRDLDISFPQGNYNNAFATGDRIDFDWGYCTLTTFLNWPVCMLNDYHLGYWIEIAEENKPIRCTADSSSQIAIDLCKAETGADTGTLRTDYCDYPCYIFRKQ